MVSKIETFFPRHCIEQAIPKFRSNFNFQSSIKLPKKSEEKYFGVKEKKFQFSRRSRFFHFQFELKLRVGYCDSHTLSSKSRIAARQGTSTMIISEKKTKRIKVRRASRDSVALSGNEWTRALCTLRHPGAITIAGPAIYSSQFAGNFADDLVSSSQRRSSRWIFQETRRS